MVVLNIYPTSPNLKEDIDNLNTSISKGIKVFILIYMEGCGPCNQVRPEWKKIENILNVKKKENILIVDLDQELLDKVKKIGSSIVGFPTIRYIQGDIVEEYEKERNIDSFIEWIKYKSKMDIQNGGSKKRTMRLRNRKINGGKWTLKYKKSINCRKPKGFSQRNYCKYSRNKK